MREKRKTMMTFAEFSDRDQFIEASEPTSQTRSVILNLLRHAQEYYQQVLANRSSTPSEKILSAQLVAVAALLGILCGVEMDNDTTILQRARGLWPA